MKNIAHHFQIIETNFPPKLLSTYQYFYLKLVCKLIFFLSFLVVFYDIQTFKMTINFLPHRIKSLTDELDEKTTTHNLLSLQLKRLQDDVRRVKRDLETKTSERADLTSKIEELNLHNDTSQHELKKLIKLKQVRS